MSPHLLILDGSKAAEMAIPFAIAAARTFGAALHLLHVLEAAAPSPQGAVDSVAWRMQRAEALAYLEGWRTRIEEPGLAVTTEVREGRPAEQALDVARSRKVDLLVLTPRGCSGRDWAAGSPARSRGRPGPARSRLRAPPSTCSGRSSAP